MTTASVSNSLHENVSFETNADAADRAFFQRYTEIKPYGMLLGQPTFQAFDAASRKLVLLRCFRLPWESEQLERAVLFGKSKSPFAVRVKDLIQRPTETILVTNLIDQSLEEWARSEAVHEKDIERLCHQIGDWMMDWKREHGRELILDFDTVRIGRTAAGRPYCRIIGGEVNGNSMDAVTALRSLVGSVLQWNHQRIVSNSAPDVSGRFNDLSSINELNMDPKSWLGWLLADHPSYRPPSVGDWLLGEDPGYREETINRLAKESHHEIATKSAWSSEPG